MTFNPHTVEDREAMVQTIGVESVEELFTPVPERVRFPQLDLPPVLTEMEAAHRLQQLADKNIVPPAEDIYLGAGSYQHYVPATVGQILSRGEFYTAYTPYQPEVSQGTLQVIYEFQSMVADLLGMEVANASMYDGATALAEGALMSVASSKKKNRVVVAGTVHPAYREVMHTYLDGSGVEIVEAQPNNPFVVTIDDIAPHITDGLACVVVQYPNFYGAIEDIQALADHAHEAGALFVVNTSAIPLGLLKAPGAFGADVVAAEGQPLGVAQSYGGPYVGLLGSKKSLVRQMPGRIAGVTTDSEGKRGFVLTLQTREQHIRREKATSNICTNQGLMATAATVYMSSLGPQGLREVARACYQHAHYLANRLTELEGFNLAFDQPFFHEFVVQTPGPAGEVNARLMESGVLGGLDLGQLDDALSGHLLLCATELNSRAGIDRFIDVVGSDSRRFR
jgi:glycine dehydrogenase subunit 1